MKTRKGRRAKRANKRLVEAEARELLRTGVVPKKTVESFAQIVALLKARECSTEPDGVTSVLKVLVVALYQLTDRLSASCAMRAQQSVGVHGSHWCTACQ